MSFDEMMDLFRKGFPGLSVPPSKISNQDLRGFWRVLDARRIGRVPVYEFLVFMRKHGAEWSMHKSPIEFRNKAIVEDLGPPAERSDDECRHIAHRLDSNLSDYWSRRGIHVRAVEKWEKFLAEADGSNNGRITFRELEYALCVKLKAKRNTAFDGPMSAAAKLRQLGEYLQDGFVIKGVSHDDLYALWCRVDASGSGQVTHKEWTLSIYRLWLEMWEDCSLQDLGRAVDKISDAALKFIGKSKNWYKVFNIVSLGAGSIGYDEFFKIVRRPLPCLAVPPSSLPDTELKGLWKAMDADRSGSISVHEFMVFMRRLEGRRGLSQSRRGGPRGTNAQKAQAMMEIARKSKVRPHLNPAQQERVKASLQKLTAEDFANAYAKWEIPWNDFVSDWEWHRVIRELLEISEEDLDDEHVHALWSKLDKEKHGLVPVAAVIELGWCA
eukprot:TRINITY_DN1065_c0_g2_i2.p1 TRINITY_DN1065_c0_g2~~TRINITY_DN1065_c0_g2_i2.p1  ORF type:complete len:506 (-),score=81.15 TRINITY_DN1065_c0_g2_i2:35-1354(-)